MGSRVHVEALAWSRKEDASPYKTGEKAGRIVQIQTAL